MKNSEKLEMLGFEIIGTGGGCEAWIQTINPNYWEQSSIKGYKCETFTMAITRDLTSDVDRVPTEFDDAFDFGVYQGTEEDFFNNGYANLSFATHSMDDVFYAIEKLLNHPSVHLKILNYKPIDENYPYFVLINDKDGKKFTALKDYLKKGD